MTFSLRLCSLLAAGTVGALAACSGQSPSANPPDAAVAPDAPALPPDAAVSTALFSYTPSWDGVVSVDVLGGFGQPTDWTAPLVSLTASGGTFTGTATLPPGNYPYVFRVIGDAAATGKTATFMRYAIDPSDPLFAACPSESPTFSANEPNPCSQLSVAASSQPPTFHVHGSVILNGAPVSGFLVVLERDETASHHFFANRATTGSDGTFDMTAAAGQYRIQVQHPDFEAKTDAQLAPATLNTVRRSISSSFVLSTDITLPAAEVAFADYPAFAPTATATLPTTFSFGTTGALSTRLDVYGTATAGKGNEIGDPWFASVATTTGSASFDGTFNTKQAAETAVALGERYFWGIEQAVAKASGVSWTRQSMVFPMVWH